MPSPDKHDQQVSQITEEMIFRMHYNRAYQQALTGQEINLPPQQTYEQATLKRLHLWAIERGIQQGKADREIILQTESERQYQGRER